MGNNSSVFWPLLVVCFYTISMFHAVQSHAGTNQAVGVKIMEKEVIGRYLADGKGISLYSFSRDEKNMSNCIEGCAANWPPFYVDPSALVEGCEQSDFSTITRSDGREQTTYKGMPLYYFKNDQFPGDTFGQGLGDSWFLVTP
jgi:predicted lipoprotein with Yx(FWY)xxD motif